MPPRLASALLLGGALACVSAPRPQSDLHLEPEHAEPDLISVQHVVLPGQTLYGIARAYGMRVDALAAANGIADPTSLKVGQILVVPGASAPVAMEPARGPPPKQAPADDEPPDTAELRAASPERPQAPGLRILDWPIRGVLYAKFGKKGKEAHDGIDLAAPAGSPIKAAEEGRVLFAGEQRGYGQIVILAHAAELVTLYAHNQQLRVRTGQSVHKGELVATVGESGRTTGPHLHFEVRKRGVPVDPLDYLVPMSRP